MQGVLAGSRRRGLFLRVRLPKNQAIWYTDGKWGAISIDIKELIRCRLGGQHLLTQRASNAEIAADLCGAQAQILRNALFTLQSRTGSSDFSGLLKTWTLRGTLHLIPESDLPLYVHQQGTAEDVCGTPWYGWMTKCGCALPPEREKAFARLIVQEIASGNDTREGLRQACQAAGMTADEEKMVFHGWGGVIGELSLLGVICAQVQEKKAYRLCAPFAPMDAAEAELTLARRYFTHYGPASLRDAAYFFRVPQTRVKAWLKQLDAREISVDGRMYYATKDAPEGEMPHVRLLSGFDPMLLGYRKEDNPILPPEHLRGVFNLTGIVHPTALADGRIVARWREKDGKVELMPFENIGVRTKKRIEREVEKWFEVKEIRWMEI